MKEGGIFILRGRCDTGCEYGSGLKEVFVLALAIYSCAVMESPRDWFRVMVAFGRYFFAEERLHCFDCGRTESFTYLLMGDILRFVLRCPLGTFLAWQLIAPYWIRTELFFLAPCVVAEGIVPLVCVAFASNTLA